MSEQGFRPQSSQYCTANRAVLPFFRGAQAECGAGDRAGLGLPAGKPLRSTAISQPRLQPSLSFWKSVLLLLLLLTICTPKSVNKAHYPKSNQSLHRQCFPFPSLFPHSAASGLSSGAMGGHRREEQPPLPPAVSAGVFPRTGAEGASYTHASAFAKP